MAVLQESPWYQEILNKGRIEGRVEELLLGIELGLELKFGPEGLQLMPEISQIADVDILRTIREGLRIMNTLDEVRHIYENNSAS
jgi:predicted transposase YdaD